MAAEATSAPGQSYLGRFVNKERGLKRPLRILSLPRLYGRGRLEAEKGDENK